MHPRRSLTIFELVRWVAMSTAILLALALSGQTASAQESYPYFVDLRDIVKYKAKSFLEMEFLTKDMTQNPSRYFPEGVNYSLTGPNKSLASRKNAVYGVEIIEQPIILDSKTVTLVMSALSHQETRGFVLRRLEITMGLDPLTIHNVKVAGEGELKETQWVMHVGLLQRKIFLEEPNLGIRKIYPITVGGLDETGAVMTGGDKIDLMTPVIQQSMLNRVWAIARRSKPEYFGGKPFMRVSSGDPLKGTGAYTMVGFHANTTSKFIRGFESHGCMRMRDKDLYELYSVLMKSKNSYIPLEMKYRIDDKFEHPFPLETNRYARVKNFGTPEHIVLHKDEEGLTVMEVVKGQPQIDHLIDR